MKRFSERCVPTKHIFVREWKLGNKIFAKGSRPVYEICDKKGCNYVLKVMVAPKWFFNRELCFQIICAKNGLCKPVSDWWLCKKSEEEGGEEEEYIKGVIITPKLKETLESKLKKNIKMMNVKKKYRGVLDNFLLAMKTLKLIFDLHQKLRVIHGDAGANNIMLDYDEKLFLIDMGLSFLMSEPEPSTFARPRLSIDYDYIAESFKGTGFESLFRDIDSKLAKIEEKFEEYDEDNPFSAEKIKGKYTIEYILNFEKDLVEEELKKSIIDFPVYGDFYSY